MTKHEAIEILSGYYEVGDDRQNTAMDLAISALEAQESSQNVPNGDFISRKAAIDAVNALPKWPDAVSAVCLDYADVMSVLQDTEKLPSAQELSNNSTKLDSGNGDCISRAAAMTEIKMIAERYTLAHEKMGEGRVEWSEYLVRMSDAFDVVRNLPSVKPYQEESV